MTQAAPASQERTPPERFFGVIVEPQTYKNLVYLLLAFPLGIAYFVVLVTGLSLGVSLAIVWIGLPILALVIALSVGATAFERAIAASLLGVEFPDAPAAPRPDGFWNRLKAMLSRPTTWQGMIFQFVKFPLGIASFTAVVTLLSVAVSFILAPFIVSIPGVQADIHMGWNTGLTDMSEAAILCAIGVFLLPIFLHILNFFAYIQGQIAKGLLSEPQRSTSAPVEASPVPVSEAAPVKETAPKSPEVAAG